MRLHPGSCIGPLLLASSAAAARSAVLFAPLDSSHASISTHLAPPAAALVVAQRLGLSQYHSLHAADPHALQAINNFSLSAPSLFDSDPLPSKLSFLVVLNGVQDPKNFINPSLSSHITIQNPPSSDSTFQFLQDLHIQHQTLHNLKTSNANFDQACDLHESYGLVECVTDWAATFQAAGRQSPLYQAKDLREIAKVHGAKSKHYKAKSAELATQLARLLANPSPAYDVTVLLTPLEEPSESFFSRSAVSHWSDRRAALARRQDLDLASGHPDAAPALTDLVIEAAQQQQQDDKNTTAPAGILPFCYRTLEDCERTTHSCSGHGACKEKYTAKFSEQSRTCYACVCKPETRDTGNGRIKTTVWAGPACQKKDVSVPFWLLFGATVGLVGAVTFGLSTLYSMGGEELPSVLSAGVGGPSARGR